jgi:2-hydroxy-3-oxopropionate reductase
MSEPVGLIGLGVMGKPMAANLLAAGYELVVHNRSAGPQSELVQLGAHSADSPREVAERTAIVILMLADDAAVRAVVESESGVLSGAGEGSLIIDMSTVSPSLSRELAARAAERGVCMLDAPVSGGETGAHEGTLSIMVGGEAADLDRARPLFEVLGARTVHVGPAGSGQVVKACNQVLVAITYAGVSEALVLGSKLGVDPASILDVLSGGLAANRIMEVKRRNFLEHDFTPGFRVDLHHKDLEIALSSSGESNAPLPLAAVVQQMFRQLRAAGRGGDDHSALLSVVEEWANHRLDEFASS